MSQLQAFFIGISTAYFAFYALNILRQPLRTRYQSLLGYLFVLFAACCMKDMVLTFPGNYNDEILNWVTLIDGTMAVAYTSLLFEVVIPGWVSTRRVCTLLIPFALFIGWYAYSPQRLIVLLYTCFIIIWALTVVFIGAYRARHYIRYVRDNYSNIDEIDVSWLGYVFWFFVVSQLLWLASSQLDSIIMDMLYYLSFILMWEVVLRQSFNHKPISFEKEESVDDDEVREYAFAGRLEKVVEERQLYRNAGLTLKDLAAEVGTNRTYLSDYFVNVKGTTFYDYINTLRIECVSIPMLQEHPEYTLEYIARVSGFKSLSTFRRAFYKIKQLTPGQFRADLSSESSLS